MTTKAVKTAKPVKKTAGKTERAAGPAAKKIVTKAKGKGSVKAPATAPAKKAAAKSAQKSAPVKSAPVKTAAAKPKPKPGPAPAAKTKKAAAPIAPPPAAKPKPRAAAPVGGPVAAPPPRAVSLAVPQAARMPLRPAAHPRVSLLKKNPLLATSWKTKPVEQWSDAEVICMPDEEYMNDKQRAFFRLKLLQLKDDILANAGETTEHLRSDTVVVPDPADRATIEEEHALELRTRDRERKLLRKIEQSVARIDADDYGYCDETGEPIGVPRLLARPTATLSLEAQQRRELKQKMFGD